MSYAWTGSLAELKRMYDDGSLVVLIADGFREKYGGFSDSEIEAWSNSIPALLEALSMDEFNDIQVILEYQMPIGAERADVILLGGNEEEKKAIVIELKQWSNADFDSDALEVNIPGIGLQQHPSIQVLNYRGKLKLFHSVASEYNIQSIVFLHNMSEESLNELKMDPVEDLIIEAPLYGKNDADRLSIYIHSYLLPIEINTNEHIRFREDQYTQTRHLFDFLKNIQMTSRDEP